MKKTEKLLASIRPYPKQQEFFLANARRIAYGGARGGGKSWAMRTKLLLLAFTYRGIQILLIRRTFPELRENHILPLRKLLKGIAQYKDSTKEFLFSNGSRIKLGYCQNESDILQYQGQAYEVIGMEEATQFTELQYTALTESNRLSGNTEGIVPRMYFTCNPGGVGHGWVKRLFVDRHYRQGENEKDYVFIPSTIYDNDYLMKNNPDYLKTLESLPPTRKKAMLYGDWDAYEGQYFSEFPRSLHVCEPFALPDDCRRFAALDYGLDMTACLWFAHSEREKTVYVYRELYESGLILTDAARRILDLNGPDPLRYIAASPDLAGRRQDSGKSGFDILSSAGLKGLIPADNQSIAGWRTIREYLKRSPDGRPYLVIFSSCKNLIRSLPALTFDSAVTEDVSSRPHEITHAPDALRYGLMSLKFLPAQKEQPAVRRTAGFAKNTWENKSEDDYLSFIQR